MAKPESLKRLLRKARMERPSADFTTSVMEGILAEPAWKDSKQPPLAHVLKRHVLNAPPSNFTFNTMKGLAKGGPIVKPLITARTWAMIVVVMSALTVMVFFSGNSLTARPSGITLLALMLGESLSTLISGLGAFGSLLLMTVVAVTGLLFLDLFLRTRSKKLGTRN